MKYIGEKAIKKLISLIKGDINKKLDKNQGIANSGKILGVNAGGEIATTDTEVATLVDVPNGLLKGDGTTISAAVAGTDYAAASHNHDSSYLKLSGGKLTGNLTGKYITGTWLQTTDATALGSAATKICVLDGSGWVYYRTPEQIRSDIGAPAADTKLSLTGGTMTGAISFSGSQERETSKLFWKDGAFCLTTGPGNVPPFKLSSNDREATLSFGPAITETGSIYYGSSISLKPNGLTISAPGGLVKITDVKSPTSDSDAANKSYVDSVAPTPIPDSTITSIWNSITI